MTRLAWNEWETKWDVNEETPAPRVIAELWWYMTSVEYDAFVHSSNTRTDPYYSDSETGRRMEVGIAMVLSRDWIKRYGDRRARMGHINNTPVIDVLRQVELGKGSTSNIRYEDFAEADAIIGRKISPKYAGD